MKIMVLVMLIYNPFASPEMNITAAYGPIESKTYEECVADGKNAEKELSLKYPNISFTSFCKELELNAAGLDV